MPKKYHWHLNYSSPKASLKCVQALQRTDTNKSYKLQEIFHDKSSLLVIKYKNYEKLLYFKLHFVLKKPWMKQLLTVGFSDIPQIF